MGDAGRVQLCTVPKTNGFQSPRPENLGHLHPGPLTEDFGNCNVHLEIRSIIDKFHVVSVVDRFASKRPQTSQRTKSNHNASFEGAFQALGASSLHCKTVAKNQTKAKPSKRFQKWKSCRSLYLRASFRKRRLHFKRAFRPNKNARQENSCIWDLQAGTHVMQNIPTYLSMEFGAGIRNLKMSAIGGPSEGKMPEPRFTLAEPVDARSIAVEASRPGFRSLLGGFLRVPGPLKCPN